MKKYGSKKNIQEDISESNRVEMQTDATTPAKADERSAPLAMGILALSITILLLVILNYIIFYCYKPDLNAILEDAFRITMKEHESFFPEPVERLQFQCSLLLTPLFILLSYLFVRRKKEHFYNNEQLCIIINISGLVLSLLFAYIVYGQKLVNIPGKTTALFFDNNFITIVPGIVALLLYAAFTYGFLSVNTLVADKPRLVKNIISFICYAIAALVVVDVFLYDVFHVTEHDRGKTMESNSVFYAITQVYAGKSLLVNVKEQYGLYPWILNPVFKITGMSTFKIGLVFATLNALSFSFFFVGIKKLLKNNWLSLVVFLCMAWWFFWSQRVVFESSPRMYYQFHPIRIFFPSLIFLLMVMFFESGAARRRMLLPILALAASLGIFWNLDSGMVTFGAAVIALVSSAYTGDSIKSIIKPGLKYSGFMIGAFLLILLMFAGSAKIASGSWPDFSGITSFQYMYYILGYYMLPMNVLNFWNFPVLVYLIAGIYGLHLLRHKHDWDTPVVVFLFILGMGIFSYFQGRSFDANITSVIYPAILLLGLFCSRLLPRLPSKIKDVKPDIHNIIFVLLFFFLTDGAFSMLYYTPAIHSYAYKSATDTDPAKEEELKKRIDFIKANFRENDTVIIIAQDYEAYYYGECHYYNPIPVPGSTELFYKTELYTLLDYLKAGKYPIVYDHKHELWLEKDTIVKTIARYNHVVKAIPDNSLQILAPGRPSFTPRLPADEHTLYYANSSDLAFPAKRLFLPDNFTIEFYATLDATRLTPSAMLFTNLYPEAPDRGMIMGQYGDTLSNFNFAYADGEKASGDITCRLKTDTENHIVIKIQKNITTIYNNGQLCGQLDTKTHLKNSERPFYINSRFPGEVKEFRISAD